MRSFRLHRGSPPAELSSPALLLIAAPLVLGGVVAFFAWLYE